MGKDTRTPEQKRTDQKAQLESMHVQLTEAVQALVTGKDWREAVQFAARFRRRSFNNVLLIRSQHLQAYQEGRVPGPEPTYVAGFTQWKQLGRTPLPGAYKIYAPVTKRFASATPRDPDSWRELTAGEKPRPGESVTTKKTGNRVASVWDVSQTTGDPIPERPRPQLLRGQAPAGLWDGLAKIVEQEGYRLLDAPDAAAIGGADGVTNLRARTVQVRLDLDEMDRCATLAHELGHIALLPTDGAGAVGHAGIGEVEAEAFSLMVAAAHGVDTSRYSVPYVSGWASTVPGSTPADVMAATGERVRLAARSVLDRLETVQVSDGDPPGLDREALRASSRAAKPRRTSMRTGRDRSTSPAEAGPSAPPVQELGL